jgi:hypothetical protein
MTDTFYLEALDGGARTRVRDAIKFLKYPFPLPRPLAVPLMRFVMKNVMKYEDIFNSIGTLIAAERRPTAPDGPD